MRIKYSRRITDGDELRPFFSLEEPEFREYPDERYVAAIRYNLRGLEKSFLDSVEGDLKKVGFATMRSANNRLWVSSPDKFSLTLDAEVSNICNYETIKRGTKTKKGMFGRREIPVYWEIPSVDVSGQVCYESFEGVEPSPVLNVLNALKYKAEVTPTPQELQNTLERLREQTELLRSRSKEAIPMEYCAVFSGGP